MSKVFALGFSQGIAFAGLFLNLANINRLDLLFIAFNFIETLPPTIRQFFELIPLLLFFFLVITFTFYYKKLKEKPIEYITGLLIGILFVLFVG